MKDRIKVAIVSVAAGAALALGTAGCELGTNPLILDGSVATAEFPVDAEIPFFLQPSFTVSDSVDLGAVFEGPDDVDSVKFYNLTFIAAGDSAGLATRLTGSISVEGVPLLHFTDVPLSAFSAERSIFAATPGFSYDAGGIGVIRSALAPGSTDRALRLSGDFDADRRSLHFSLQAKIYTQVFISTER